MTDSNNVPTAWLPLLTAPPEPDVAVLMEQIAQVMAAAPPPGSVDAITYRELSDAQARATRGRRDDVAEERTVDVDGRPLQMRVFVPEQVDGVYLYIHGGAWIGGGRDLADEILWPRAQRADVAVVSIDYRLAPEHRWPVPGDDCERAALWLVEHAAAEFGTDRLLIGGDSAGAHLSAVTLLRLRDRHGMSPFLGADLRYGMYDMRLTPSARLTKAGFFDAPTLQWVVDNVFDPELRDTPDASPLLAELRDLPPALFTVGTGDSLVDDTLLMYMRWVAAGNEASLALHPGCPHAFDYFPLAAAGRAVDDSVAFIRRCLDADHAEVRSEPVVQSSTL